MASNPTLNFISETPILWPPHEKSWLIGKDSDAGRDWGQEEKGTTEDEMAGWSLTRWTWVWVNSGSWWWTGRPGVLRFMGSQRVRHDWVTELNWTELNNEKTEREIKETIPFTIAMKRIKYLGMLLPVLLLSRFSRVRLYATPWIAAHQASLLLGFSR